ncbi:hypothetical protein FHW16_004858 [Phyllobacterium myrsinacearum]|uniref:Uncharacterized protein n=1 Tax=Phyllobacterium myrsinacearum TaxID=28101 RepID=A0A839EKY2_9HYPH|nr:hypothetical protein [Phyllobacterium myrsinacearum]
MGLAGKGFDGGEEYSPPLPCRAEGVINNR